jgi:hypothetical protein
MLEPEQAARCGATLAITMAKGIRSELVMGRHLDALVMPTVKVYMLTGTTQDA